MKLTKEQKENYNKYFIDCIDIDEETNETDADKIIYLRDRFYSEYGWNIKRIGEQKAMIEWLQGLAVNIPYLNHTIIKLAIRFESITEEATDKEKEKILDNYWIFVGNIYLKLFKQYSLYELLV